MENFKKWMREASLEEMKGEYTRARDAYYNSGNTTLTDDEYDRLEETIRESVPNWSGLKKTGAPAKLGKKQEVKLPVPAPSLDKLVAEKPEGVMRWLTKAGKNYGADFRLSEKIDGSSVIGAYRRSSKIKSTPLKLSLLATRGDGETGKDITFLAPYLTIPQEIADSDLPDEIVIRFEAVMPVAVYNKRWAGQYDTNRALASAVLNRQDAAPALKDLHFVALQVLKPNWPLDAGLEYLEQNGFRVAAGKVVDVQEFTLNNLTRTLEYFRGKSLYECDGMVIYSNSAKLTHTNKRPDHGRAFKLNDSENALETTIIDMVWKPSAFGVLVPKAVISPIKIGGATIRNAAVHNAKWATTRGAGIGAVVRVLRSGDIIPKIVEVVKPAKFKLPSQSEFGAYSWDETETALVLNSKTENPEVLARMFTRFFETLGLEQMAFGVSKKMVEAGYTKTWQALLMKENDFRKLGIKARAPEFAANMEEVRGGSCTVIHLMVASGVFDKGLGKTRLQTLQENYPKALKVDAVPQSQEEADALRARIAKISGCGPAFAEIYVRGLKKFYRWVDRCNVRFKPIRAPKAVQGPLTGLCVSWTTYRSEEEEETVKSLGGEVVPFGSRTNALLYDPDGKASSKPEKARAKGIKVFSSFEAFKKATRI